MIHTKIDPLKSHSGCSPIIIVHLSFQLFFFMELTQKHPGRRMEMYLSHFSPKEAQRFNFQNVKGNNKIH